MRMNFIAQATPDRGGSDGSGLISLLIRPACGVAGDFLYSTDRMALLRMLRQETELQSTILERFDHELETEKRARLLGVNISERALQRIGYFVD
jgi:hypothetical protein